MLPIFPRSGFDHSVTTPVLIGLLVSWALTETLGWVFAGLVVPGYLGAIFLLEPVAATIDLFEAVITYGVARALGEYLPRLGVTSRVFGRERFFLVVLVSILVRLAVEGWLLPHAVPHATWAYSVGLVVVPLAANACWKTGFVRGVVQHGIPTLIVYLALRWVLIPHTNLSLAGFELGTENLAGGFLSSPKSYMLLLTGAMIAAAANVRYGWDFNGILVPALLGLAVVEPIKFGATFAETLILCAAVAALKVATPLKRMNIEGPRKTVLFFTVDYALRFAAAFFMGHRFPGGNALVFMGFGYLLPTLLAVKISQKSSAALVLLPTLKVSLLGFVVGSLIGFAGHLLDRVAVTSPQPTQTRKMPRPPASPAGAALWLSQLAIDDLPEPSTNVTGDLGLIRERLEAEAHFLPTGAPNVAAVEKTAIDDGVYVVRERFDTLVARRGTPAYAFRAPLPPHAIVALVPTPLGCPTCAALAGELLHTREIDAVVIAGIEETKDTWALFESTAHAAARWLAGGGQLVIVRDAGDPRIAKIKARQGTGIDARVEALAKSVNGKLLALAGFEALLIIDAREFANRLAPTRAPVALDNATDISAALAPIRAATHPGDLEHLMALRRLLLNPLLAPGANESARALAPFAAEMLGYRWTTPTRWAGGGEAIALLPTAKGLPIAVIARTSGVRTSFVEAPFGSHEGIRDLSVRVAIALDADALVLGEVFDGAMHGGAVRAAHSAATDDQTPTVFVVREDPASQVVSLASWMDSGGALARAQRVLSELGVASTFTPPDLAMRDLATRTLLRPTALVAISAGTASLTNASLAATRHAHEHLTALPVRDGTLRDAAFALASGLANSRPPARSDISEIVRRASSDGSVTAARAMEIELASTDFRAAIVRAKEGSFVVAVARTRQANRVIVSPLSDTGSWHTERRSSLAECIQSPIPSGVCEASTR